VACVAVFGTGRLPNRGDRIRRGELLDNATYRAAVGKESIGVAEGTWDSRRLLKDLLLAPYLLQLHFDLLEDNADVEYILERNPNALKTEVSRNQKLEWRRKRSLRFGDLALAGTEQQMLDLLRFLQNDVRCTRSMVDSNLTADTPSVYRPYAVYDRSAGERRALHLAKMDWLVAQEQETSSPWTYHGSKPSMGSSS